jgi:hypothetical protein
MKLCVKKEFELLCHRSRKDSITETFFEILATVQNLGYSK